MYMLEYSSLHTHFLCLFMCKWTINSILGTLVWCKNVNILLGTKRKNSLCKFAVIEQN